jgi:catecholate siderophore receptor
MRLSSLLLASAALFAGTSAAAEALDADADTGLITVTAPRDLGYRATGTSTATRTDTPLLDVPQTVDAFTRDRLDDQAILSISDALRYVPGAVAAQGEGNRDQIVLRGNNSTADFFVDGLRDDVQYFRDFYNTERLEILKGPNALIFGRGGGGGIVNRVSKTPQDQARIAGDVSADTYGAWRLGADLNTPVAKGVNARLAAVFEDGRNHRQIFELERWGINPTLGLALGERGNVVIGYEHVDDQRVSDRGIPSANGGPITGFRDTFFGSPDRNRVRFNADIVGLAADYALTDTLSIRQRARYGDYDKLYRNLFPVTAVGPDGRFGVEAYQDTTRRQNLLSQTDLVWKVETGPADHILLTGIELGRQTTRSARLNGFFDNGTGGFATRTSAMLANPFAAPDFVLRGGAGTGERNNRTRADIFAAFVQDQISIGEHVEIVAGIRYDRFSLGYADTLTGATLQRTDNLWSPRVGVILQPVRAASLYFSFSRSFLPQSGDQFTSLSASTASLEPERFRNLEVGAKWDITPALNLAAALYQLDRTNTRATDPSNGNVVLSGAQRSKGFELALNGRILPNWQATAGLAIQDAEITRTTTAAPAGRKVPLVPRTQVSLWTRYDLDPRFGLGLGVTHQGRSFASISNTVTLPAYTRVDAAAFFKLTDRIDAQVNIENLFNTGYFPTAQTDNNISTGGPRSARFTLRARL